MDTSGIPMRLRIFKVTFAPLLTIVFHGCISVGPDYEAPTVELQSKWQADLPGMHVSELDPQWIAQFWQKTEDPALNELVHEAVKNNRTLMQAADRLVAARANRGLAYAAFFPTVDANGVITDQQSRVQTDHTPTTSTDLTKALLERNESGKPVTSRKETRTGSLDASWEIDLFGGNRRALEAAEADLQSSHEAYRDALTSLVAEVALNYISLRTYERRLEIAENNLKIQQSSLDLALYRVQAGLSDGLDEEQARLSIETTKSQIPTLKAGIAQTRFTLAALLGLQPESFSKKMLELLAAKTRPRLPDRLVIDTPADAIRRRPDIRRAERKLAAETARIGVRKSDLYPKLTLPGTLSYTTTGSTDTSIASIGLRLSWNIFDAGAIRRRVDIQKATQSEAFHAYEQTLFTALSEINGALVAYTQEEERRLALGRAAAHAEKAAMLTRLKYQTGLVAFSDVLTAEQTMLSRQNELAVSEGESISNFIRLYRVLGGGWQSYAPEEEAREKPE